MKGSKEEFNVEKALKYACNLEFGPLSGSFLCQSIGCIDPNDAVCLNVNTTLEIVIEKLKENKIGCIQIVNDDDELAGIFSERDWILKVANKGQSLDESVEKFMTKDPITVDMLSPIAYAINLMSSGGFRHLPIVDADKYPVGMLSVKNILDYLAESALSALLKAELDLNNF